MLQLTAENFAARLKQDNSVGKTTFDNKLVSFNRKIASNKIKYLEFVLVTIYFTSNDGSQSTFVYQRTPTIDKG